MAGFLVDVLNIDGLSEFENVQVEDRLHKTLSSWAGTPYMPGGQAKGVGVDCVRFVSGALDDLFGDTTPIENLPQDMSFHDPAGAKAGLRRFLSSYLHMEVKGNRIQPGDIVVAGPVTGGPGHALICGLRSLWHCDEHSVAPAGLNLVSGGAYFVKKVYRILDRERWLHGCR